MDAEHARVARKTKAGRIAEQAEHELAGLTTGILAELESMHELDAAAGRLRGVVHRLLPQGVVRDVLRGVPFGHPLHPTMVQLPLGAWMSAVVLDLLPGHERAARALVGIGTLAAAPAVVAGAADWLGLHPRAARVGVVHAASNLLATTLFAASFLQRMRGGTKNGMSGRSRGVGLALLGLTAATVGGYLGGHLAYRQGAGVTPAGPAAGSDAR